LTYESLAKLGVKLVEKNSLKVLAEYTSNEEINNEIWGNQFVENASVLGDRIVFCPCGRNIFVFNYQADPPCLAK
jgi:hypothetical protein